MKKEIIITAVVIAAVAFYAGMQYGAKNLSAKNAQEQLGRGGFASGNIGGGQRGAGGQRGSSMQNSAANGGAGDFASGEIIAKDDSSITIKTRDGGSKIIFFSDKTTIDKSVSGATSDLNVGQQITVNGKTSTDGSVTAQNIQVRPLSVK